MPSQKPVEAPHERPSHSLTDNTIPDNEHARIDAMRQLEDTRLIVAEEQAEKARTAEVERKKDEQEAEALAQAEKQAEAKKKEPEKKQVVVSRSSAPKAEPTRVFEATFYTAFCDTGCTGVTATGMNVKNTIYSDGLRIIAVDPSVIPLYSIVRVTLADGTSFTAIAGDTGGHIDGYRIDVLVGTNDEARKLGRQRVSVKVLKSGN